MVTMPKLPPPPRIAQNNSVFSFASAQTMDPSAVTTSTPVMWFVCRPSLREYVKMPPPSE